MNTAEQQTLDCIEETRIEAAVEQQDQAANMMHLALVETTEHQAQATEMEDSPAPEEQSPKHSLGMFDFSEEPIDIMHESEDNFPEAAQKFFTDDQPVPIYSTTDT
ncbi:hypothetical protein F511_21323 [Dorcoceras hygrometricum]|uniref:Uncharacterized protein n=1 Tax=Dorcoceras hygrometricum TaxID=472368 RepID=A0A2Z7DIK6_9LAMI|nr:hypothetical protein F511_21323 [Dorcoceras hygrometricum]